MIIFRYYIKHNNGIFNNHLKDIDKIKTLTNKLLRGEVVVKNIKQQCLAFQKLYLADIKLNMTIIKFNNCNDSINSYIDNIVKTCTAMDINYHINTLDALTITETQFIDMIKSLNEQSAIHGYIIPLPLPFTINMNNIYQSIAPLKDVDGCSLINLGQLIKQQPPLIVPATAAAVLRLINHYQIKLINTYVVIVGASMQVGKPLANLLWQHHAIVTICNILTKNLKTYTQQADILIVAVGKINLITRDMVKVGSIVIDIGCNYNDQATLVGDVDFAAIKDHVAGITPVPGGIGPITSIMLMMNLLKLYAHQHQLPTDLLD